MNAALVMRDRETDSWWSIITGDAIGGLLDGTPLKEMSVTVKAQWRDWKQRHPDTVVLSVDGKEHDDRDPYGRYFSSEKGFGDLTTRDDRFAAKEPVYAFQFHGTPYAVSHGDITGGAVFSIDEGFDVFFYREPGSSMFASTLAYVSRRRDDSSRFVKKAGNWIDRVSGVELSAQDGLPVNPEWKVDGNVDDDPELGRLGGFDTFWYIWSATHEGVVVLE